MIYPIGILTKKGVESYRIVTLRWPACGRGTKISAMESISEAAQEDKRSSTDAQMHRCTEEHKRICSAIVSLFVNLGHLDKQAAQEITIPSKSSRQRFSEARQGPRQQMGWGTWLGPPCYRWRRWGHLRPLQSNPPANEPPRKLWPKDGSIVFNQISSNPPKYSSSNKCNTWTLLVRLSIFKISPTKCSKGYIKEFK